MSAFSINRAEKKILTHIELGGELKDSVGISLVYKFASTALNDSSIFKIATKYHISLEDICAIYIAMINRLMPNPCIYVSGLLLVPTLIFMEPIRFEGLASEIYARTDGLSGDERVDAISFISGELASQIWQTHAATHGPPRFTIKDAGGRTVGGCFTMLLIIFSVASATGYGIYRIF
jgi:hypothetical protein